MGFLIMGNAGCRSSAVVLGVLIVLERAGSIGSG